MLFNSFQFIFLFLPLIVTAFALAQKYIGKNTQYLLVVLLAGSLIFYAQHSLKDLAIMVASIGVNFLIGQKIYQNKRFLVAGLIFNLGLISYFKYTFFIAENVADLLDTSFTMEKMALPLGISFFTFQQIAYLVDTYRTGQPERKFTPYALLVSFFPHSIAGPLVQYKEILPQLRQARISTENFSVGMTIFIIGLFKKVVIADSLAPGANIVFDNAASGIIPTTAEAWIGALCYTFQLYFDFSGYSDMAIGLARIFNINFPFNFDSPYKATSIIDFWRRWHITLSLFLKNYVYIPLGGSRHGTIKKYRNLLFTMFLCGLWHGAGWTFILWGLLHGLLLVGNHGWNSLQIKLPRLFTLNIAGWILTMLCVIAGWVLFRSQNIHTALTVYAAMLGQSQTGEISLENKSVYIIMLTIALFISISLPNIKDFMADRLSQNEGSKGTTTSSSFFKWSPSVTNAFCVSLMTLSILICMAANKKMEFLYFNF
ncbi:MAG: membrane-bound O-acyltransferase family protein [Micavibrio aeruginosavorus]|uniref:Membrane-bound O-acyltransferase family protein n=1 Tax=Micavibrio aeruginosavorus TaxID=349221 RepID=A0A2W5FE51_9BACT|nr:MAG: membrane-bound O-acyltransferase family protein [Micavibrio aeruginosavorus]